MSKARNLSKVIVNSSGVVDKASLDTTLSITGTAANVTGTVAIANGGTGATSASAARTALGLGTAATTASTDYATAAQGTKADSALQPAAIGSTVQGYDADLATIAGLTPTNNYAIIGNGTSWTSSALPASGVTSVTGTSPISSSGGATPAISISQASGSTNGYLSSTDWTTFNSKQPAGTYVTSVSGTTGRTTSSGGTTPAIDLASGIVTAGTTGSSSLIPVVTVDTYGRVTSITTASNPQGTVTGVTGTSPISSSGGATPDISISQASGSTNGYLSSTDWTTFNNKSNVTNLDSLTDVTITSPATDQILKYNGSGWVNGASSGGGGQFFGTAAVKAIAYNSNSIAENLTVTTGNNGYSAGPITLSAGYTVTVQAGSRWVVL